MTGETGINEMDFIIDAMKADDWPQVRAIYAEGIATGQATFETEEGTWPQWDANHLPCCRMVARRGDAILGWAALAPVSRRQCYRGVAEVSVYVGTGDRGRGIGGALLRTLIDASEAQGLWTLQGVTLAENTASLRLLARHGFRVVGRRERIAQLRGVWRDTVVAERRSPAVGTGEKEG
jgi:L-amino acid N-acyltransferase YncA